MKKIIATLLILLLYQTAYGLEPWQAKKKGLLGITPVAASGGTDFQTLLASYSPNWWLYCDETTGTTIANYGSEGSADGTVSGTHTLNQTSLLADGSGASILLNGGEILRTGVAAIDIGSSDYTVIMLVKITSLTLRQVLFSKRTPPAGSANGQILFDKSASGGIGQILQRNAAATTPVKTSGGSTQWISANTNTLLIFSIDRDSESNSFFRSNSTVSAFSVWTDETGVLPNNGLTIGRAHGDTLPINGYVQHVAIIKRAITSTEGLDLYTAFIAP